jgi:hypothetical protein
VPISFDTLSFVKLGLYSLSFAHRPTAEWTCALRASPTGRRCLGVLSPGDPAFLDLQ